MIVCIPLDIETVSDVTSAIMDINKDPRSGKAFDWIVSLFNSYLYHKNDIHTEHNYESYRDMIYDAYVDYLTEDSLNQMWLLISEVFYKLQWMTTMNAKLIGVREIGPTHLIGDLHV